MLPGSPPLAWCSPAERTTSRSTHHEGGCPLTVHERMEMINHTDSQIDEFTNNSAKNIISYLITSAKIYFTRKSI